MPCLKSCHGACFGENVNDIKILCVERIVFIACIGEWPLRGCGQCPLLDHDHDTYGRLKESGIGGFIYMYIELQYLK